MVFFTDDIEYADEAFILAIKPYVSQERWDYAGKYLFFRDKVLSLTAYILLRVSLYKEYKYCGVPHLRIAGNGKPELVEMPDVYFNLSHCKTGAACAISDGAVGVDIQDYICYSKDISDNFMSDEEKKRAGNSIPELTRIWALKESYGKYHGVGICYDMCSKTIEEGVFKNQCISRSRLFEKFAVAVTSTEEMELIRLSLSQIAEICKKIKRSAPHNF